MKFLYNLIFLLTSYNCFAGVIPIAAKFNGAGGVYGIGYESQYRDYKLLAGAIDGGVSAFGAMLTKKLSESAELSFALAQVNNISLLTTYNRGLDRDDFDQYILNTKGSVFSVGSKSWWLDDYISTGFSLTKSTFQFEDFESSGGEVINLGGANLFDVETLEAKVSIDYNFFDNARSPSSGYGFNTSLSHISGRTGQSDQFILDYSAVGILPVSTGFSILSRVGFSDAVVNVNSKYDSKQEIQEALGANCSLISDTRQRAKCSKLEEELVAYILKNNTLGTARPLGGSSGLRSFRELRFKSAHKAFYSLELVTNLSEVFELNSQDLSRIDIALFYDLGFSNDDKTQLFEESKFSNGVEFRFVKASNSVKLQVAAGSDDTSAWSLGFGRAY